MSRLVKIFSIITFVLGIISIAFALIPAVNIFGIICGAVGIGLGIFSKIKAKKELTVSKLANIGFVLAIIGTAISFVMIIVYAVIFSIGIYEFISSGIIEDFFYSLMKTI